MNLGTKINLANCSEPVVVAVSTSKTNETEGYRVVSGRDIDETRDMVWTEVAFAKQTP